MRVLVVAAHPDDEVLGCAGAMMWHLSQGREVHVLILTDGAKGRYDREKAARLQECARASADYLGVNSLTFGGLPNQALDTVPLTRVIQVIEGKMDQIGPGIMYAHHGGDLNLDHAIAHRACLTAARPLPGAALKELYAFHVPSSSEWGQVEPHLAFLPNVYLELTGDMLARKTEAMALYESEAHPYPHPRSTEALRIDAAHFGVEAGLAHAEPFRLLRKLQD